MYQLTEWGAELEPVFEALARWGMRSPVVKREGRLSADSVMLAVRSFFRAGDQPWTATYEFRLDADVYRVRVVDGRLAELARGEVAGQPDARIEGDRMAVHELIETGTAPEDVTDHR